MAFKVATYKKEKVKKGQTSVKTLHSHECKACPLNKAKVYTPKMAPSGADKPDVYFLGGNPNKASDRNDNPCSGDTGRMLHGQINKWKTDVEVRFNNCTRTHKDGPIGWQEMDCCRPSIIRDIESSCPTILVLVGNVALKWAIGSEGVFSWRGRYWPMRFGEHTCWVTCTWDPQDVIDSETKWRKPLETDLGKIFIRDIRDIPARLSEREPFCPTLDDIRSGISCIDGTGGDGDLRKVEKFLAWAANQEAVGYDYETNALRPYGNRPKLLSVAIGTLDRTMAIALDHPEAGWSPKQRKKLDKLLEDFIYDAPCTKVAHNLQMEHEWTNFFYGGEALRAQPWGDTMAQMYTLDERSSGGVLQLDNTVMLNYGFTLKDVTTYKFDMSRMEEEPLDEVLPYNGRDAKWTHGCYELMLRQLVDQQLKPVYDNQVRRIATIVLTQDVGLHIDFDEVRASKAKLADQIKDLEDIIFDDPDVIAWEKRTGEDFQPGSPKEVKKLFQSLGHNINNADESVLKKIGTDLALNILALRKPVKLKSTYVDPIDAKGKFIWEDGLVHSKYNLIKTRTGRTSSEEPNIQNQPKRGEGYWTRKHYIPPPGHFLIACDYGQIEARVIAMATKDKSFVNALWNNYDVHMEWAEKVCAVVDPWFKKLKDEHGEKALKEARQLIKNKLVFPAFFGAREQSIDKYLGFEPGTLKDIFEEFWDVFSGVKKWQKKILRQYNDDGYVTCLTGRRRQAPITANQIINTPIQGTASDIVINAMDRLSELSWKEDNPAIHPIWNIHDDIGFYIPKKTLDRDLEIIIKTMLEVPFDFVNVPISIEIEGSDQNWFKMESIGEYASNE